MDFSVDSLLKQNFIENRQIHISTFPWWKFWRRHKISTEKVVSSFLTTNNARNFQLCKKYQLAIQGNTVKNNTRNSDVTAVHEKYWRFSRARNAVDHVRCLLQLPHLLHIAHQPFQKICKKLRVFSLSEYECCFIYLKICRLSSKLIQKWKQGTCCWGLSRTSFGPPCRGSPLSCSALESLKES